MVGAMHLKSNAYFEDRAAGGKRLDGLCLSTTITHGLMCALVYSGHLQWPVNEAVTDQVKPYVHMFWSALCYHSRECDTLATC